MEGLALLIRAVSMPGAQLASLSQVRDLPVAMGPLDVTEVWWEAAFPSPSTAVT